MGRFWIEALRIDEAHTFLGLRLNDWTSIVVFVGAVAYLVIVGRRRPGREDPDSVDPAARAEREEAAVSHPSDGDGPTEGSGDDGGLAAEVRPSPVEAAPTDAEKLT